MFQNLKKMGIKNPIILYFIRQKLLKKAIKTWNEIHIDNPIKMDKIKMFFGFKNKLID